jgi:hypothetical protein
MPRVDWQPRSPLSALSLATDQAWRRQLLRRHNRFLHGAGIVCGLHVVPASETGRPWAIRICPGYGLSAHGDEITLCCSVVIDIADWLWARYPSDAPVAVVAVQPAELPGALRSQQCGRCCHTSARQHTSRAREITVARILWGTPEPGLASAATDICRDLPGCAPCPDDPSLPLAFVKLPPDQSVPIVESDITPA